MIQVGAAATTTSGPLLGESHVVWVALGIGLIALIVVLQPWLLARTYHARRSPPAAATGQTQEPDSFFQIPYITWFLIHHGIAALALLAIVFLGVDNVIDKGTVSALIGSLLGYAIGSAANSSRTPAPNQGGSGSSGQANNPIAPVNPAPVVPAPVVPAPVVPAPVVPAPVVPAPVVPAPVTPAPGAGGETPAPGP